MFPSSSILCIWSLVWLFRRNWVLSCGINRNWPCSACNKVCGSLLSYCHYEKKRFCEEIRGRHQMNIFTSRTTGNIQEAKGGENKRTETSRPAKKTISLCANQVLFHSVSNSRAAHFLSCIKRPGFSSLSTPSWHSTTHNLSNNQVFLWSRWCFSARSRLILERLNKSILSLSDTILICPFLITCFCFSTLPFQ